MSRKTAILIIVLVLVLGTAVLYFLLGGRAGEVGRPIFDFPFGRPPEDGAGGPDTSGTGSGTGTTGPLDGISAAEAGFVRLSDVPVAGFGSVVKNGATYARYVERATGHVVDVNPATLERAKILNTTMPKVYEAIFRQDGSGYVARTLAQDGETISNTSITIIAPTATSSSYTAQSIPLRGNLGDLVVLPNNSLLYVIEDTGAVATASWNGSQARTLFTLPFTEWRLNPISNLTALITTRASESAEGYAYSLNLSNGRLTKILGPLQALTALPNPDGSRVAFAHTNGGEHVLTVTNPAIEGTANISPVTLPEKCAWSREFTSIIICGVPEDGLGNDAPDSWYEGTRGYSDRVWRFNADTDTAELLLDPEEKFNTQIDVMSPALSSDENYLFFINKGDLTLWSLRLPL